MLVTRVPQHRSTSTMSIDLTFAHGRVGAPGAVVLAQPARDAVELPVLVALVERRGAVVRRVGGQRHLAVFYAARIAAVHIWKTGLRWNLGTG